LKLPVARVVELLVSSTSRIVCTPAVSETVLLTSRYDCQPPVFGTVIVPVLFTLLKVTWKFPPVPADATRAVSV
jgi:hypothetical protein